MTPGALLLALAVIGGLLAYEPAQILLGGRGPRARRDAGRAAIWWGGVWAVVALVCGVLGTATLGRGARWAIACPLLPAGVVFLNAALGREKTAVSEIGAATAFSLAAIPMSLAGGSGVDDAVAVGAVYAVTFTLMTLAVRVVVFTTRGGGNVRAALATRRGVVGVGAAAVVAAAMTSAAGLWSPFAPVALVPGLLASLWIAHRPPPARRLRTVGWALVATSVATFLTLLLFTA